MRIKPERGRSLSSLLGLFCVGIVIVGTQPGEYLMDAEVENMEVVLVEPGSPVVVPLLVRFTTSHPNSSTRGDLWVKFTVHLPSVDSAVDTGDTADREMFYDVQMTLEDGCGVTDSSMVRISRSHPGSDSDTVYADFSIGSDGGEYGCSAERWTCAFEGDTCDAPATLSFELIEGSNVAVEWEAWASVLAHVGCGAGRVDENALVSILVDE
jgi:hypothetical protein